MDIQIGNPLLNLDRDAPATYEFFWSHGMISDEVGLAIMRDCDFDDYVLTNPHNVSKSCDEAMSAANSIVGEYINNYDVLLDVCYPSIVQQELRLKKLVRTNNTSFSFFVLFFLFMAFFSFWFLGLISLLQATKISMGVDVCMTYERHFYFNLPEVQKALHANRTNLPYEWSMCSE